MRPYKAISGTNSLIDGRHRPYAPGTFRATNAIAIKNEAADKDLLRRRQHLRRNPLNRLKDQTLNFIVISRGNLRHKYTCGEFYIASLHVSTENFANTD